MLGFKRKPNKREITISFIAFVCILIALFTALFFYADVIEEKREARIPAVSISIETTTKEAPAATTDVIPVGETDQLPAQTTLDALTPDTTVETEETPTQKKQTDSANISAVKKEQKEIKTLKRDDFIEKSPLGLLPKKDAYNRAPWKYYSKNFISNGRDGRIALIINNVGFDEYKFKTLLSLIPDTVTLALNPYSDIIDDAAYHAQQAGHEYLMMLPMEASNYPINDPGSKALLTTISRDKNLENLHWSMSRSTGYVGLINYMGKAFSRPNTTLKLLFSELSKRGLLFINSLGLEYNIGEEEAFENGVPYLSVDLIVDEIKTEKAIEQQLRSLELLSKEFGYAIGIIHNYPFSIKKFTEWEKTLKNKNIELVPITNLFLQPSTP